MSPPLGTEVPFRRLITLSIMLATIMQALDTTIANVALPHMRGTLSADQDQISWVLTSYIVAAAITMPMTGWLSGRFGRKRIFLISVAGFTVASVLCGLAETLVQMVGYRLLQGVFGAALVPLSQSVLLDINPREKHASAMAIWGAGIMVGPILGPTLGGWLTENYNWRWVFYINLPVGILAFFGILSFVQETVKDRARPFDFFGFAALSLGIGAMQMMLDRGDQKDWFGSTEIIVELGLCLAGFWVFAIHALTTEHPFLDPRLLKDRNYAVGLLLIFIVGIVLLATLALLPPLLQDIMDYPVVTTGEILGPRGIGTMVAMIAMGRLIGKIDPRLVIGLGFALTALSLWQMTAYSPEMDWYPVIISGTVQGLGLGFIFVPLSALTFATLTPASRTEAAAVYNLMRNLGSSVGISLVNTLWIQETQAVHASIVEHVTPYNRMFDAPVLQHLWNLHSAAGRLALNAEITRQASMVAYLDDFKFMMVLTAAAMPLLLLLHHGRHRAAAPSDAPEPAVAIE